MHAVSERLFVFLKMNYTLLISLTTEHAVDSSRQSCVTCSSEYDSNTQCVEFVLFMLSNKVARKQRY